MPSLSHGWISCICLLVWLATLRLRVDHFTAGADGEDIRKLSPTKINHPTVNLFVGSWGVHILLYKFKSFGALRALSGFTCQDFFSGKQ